MWNWIKRIFLGQEPIMVVVTPVVEPKPLPKKKPAAKKPAAKKPAAKKPAAKKPTTKGRK